MQVIILAAGLGTRMKPLTETTAKPMIPLKGKPKLQYTLDWLPREIDEIIFVTNHLGEQIKDYFRDSYAGKKITYVFQEQINGTGAAVHECKDIVRDEFLVMYGDDLYAKDDIKKMLRHKFAVSAFRVEDPAPFGILICDEGGNLIDIVEKPHDNQSNLVFTGLAKLSKQYFDYPLVPVYNGTEFGLPQTMATMRKEFPIAIEIARIWKPLGKIEDIAEAEQSLQDFIN